LGLSVLWSATAIIIWVLFARGGLWWILKRVFDWTYDRRGDQTAEEFLAESWPRLASIPRVQMQVRLLLLRRLRADGDKVNAKFVAVLLLEVARAGHISFTHQCLKEIAEVYEWCRDWEAALPLREEDWLIQKDHYGADDPRAIIAMEWIATDARRLDDLDRAESLLREALSLWRAGEGEGGPHWVHAEVQLGITLQMAGQSEEAVALLQHGLALVSGKDAMVSGGYAQLASAQSKLGDHAAAIRSQQRSLDLDRVNLASNEPTALLRKRNLATYHWRADNLSAAETTLAEVLANYERARGADSPEAAEIRVLLAELRSET
jgi:tetratricopeptide (TPR) repeat protein